MNPRWFINIGTRVIAPLSEGAGYVMPGPRNPAHEPVNWFQTDYDDQYDDPDTPFVDPLPTERHRRVPDVGPTPE